MKNKPISQAQERYHGPLIHDEITGDHFKIISWLALFVNLIFVFGTSYIDKGGPYYYYFISTSILCFISGFLSFFNRFEVLKLVLTAVNFLIFMVAMDFGGLVFLVGNDNIYSMLAFIYLGVIFVLFIVMTIIYSAYYLPKNQGKVWKINQWETYGVDKKDKKSQFKQNFLIALAALILGPAILTGNGERVFGFFLGVLMTAVFPVFIVDALYGAYYVAKHLDYE